MSLKLPKRLQAPTPSHARSRVQEKETAKRLGGVQVKASGAGDEKGDVRLRGFIRVENKTTKNRSFSVTTEMIEKLELATFGSNEVPILQVELELGKHKVLVLPDWALDLIKEALTRG
jgi:hypothetical protein